MKRTPQAPVPATPLRQQAEMRVRERSASDLSGNGMVKSPADSQRLLHELQVHQIELEMQNEELRKARDEMEAGLEKYSELYDFAPVGYLTLDREGAIREANLTAASLVGIPRSALVKQLFGFLVVPADRRLFHDFLRRVFENTGRKECDVKLLVKNKTPVDVRMRANFFAFGEVCWVAVSDIGQHKRAEAATAQLAAIVTSSGDAIVGKDLNGIVTSWNAGAEKLFGYSAGEMVGSPMTRLIPADRLAEEEKIIRRIRKGGSVEMETVRLAKNGRRLDMSITVSPIRYSGGEIVGASTVARDISEHKRAQDEVRVSEIRYRRLFEAANDGVLLLDPDTRKITDANPFMTELLGYGRDRLIGKELFEIGLLKDESASQEMFRKLKRKHEVRYEDLPLKSAGGRQQEVEVVANLYRENGHDVIQCNIRDITARKQSENALVASEARYRSLFDFMDEGFCVIELIMDLRGRCTDFRYLAVNPSFERQSGIRGAVGKRIREIAPKFEGHWFETFGEVVRTGKPVRFTDESKALKRWFDCYGFRLGGVESRRVAVLFRDVTTRRKAEDALQVARTQLAHHADELERKVAERTAELTSTNQRLEVYVDSIKKGREKYRSLLLESEFMQKKLRSLARQILTAQEDERRNISRELHDEVVQTLVGINVELSALGRAAALGPRRLNAKIARTQRHVEKSVNAVHRFARELRPTVLDDLGLIPALRAYMKGVAGRKKLKINLTAFAGVEELDGAGRTVLFRVVQEALTNVARHAQASVVNVTISEIAGAVRLVVRDNGKSFQVLQTLSAKTNQRLGLLGMRERVEIAGGTLNIESTPGQGTTVRTEIPFFRGGG